MERVRITATSAKLHGGLDTAQFGRREILLLDDDDASLGLLQGLLEADGYACIATRRPEEALALVASNHNIGVVISDICMPDVDGLMFLDRLNRLQIDWPAPQVLFLTGQPSVDNAVAALRRGAIDFLIKPLKPRELLDAVRRACERTTQITSTAVSDQGAVMELAEQAAELADRLRLLSAPTLVQVAHDEHDSVTAGARAHGNQNVEREDEAGHLLDTIELLRSVRSGYEAKLGEMDDVAWELLLEVLRSDRDGRRISVSGLSISIAGISSTTALRRINELVVRGHLHRVPDLMDARRDFVTVDKNTSAVLTDYLGQVAERLAQRAHT